MRARVLPAGILLVLAALLPGCRENLAAIDIGEVEPGRLRFFSEGVYEAGFSAEGVPTFTRHGRVERGRWALAGQSWSDPERMLTVVAHRGGTRDSSMTIAFQLPRDGAERIFRIRPSCSQSDCITMSLFFGADPARPSAESADMTCEMIDGDILIDRVDSDRATGRFYGIGLCRRGLSSSTEQFGINSGQFDVPVVEQYRVTFEP